LNATDPNLKQFEKRGGKLILYHGWSDIAIPPANTVAYYKSVLAAMGAKDSGGFTRLFIAPGMQHCLGGPGPNFFNQFGTRAAGDAQHDALTALEEWVEKGVAPEKIIAAKYANDLEPNAAVKVTRPLCAYPQVAKYKGSGDANDATSFVCAPGRN
jgi:feruloyl esterase